MWKIKKIFLKNYPLNTLQLSHWKNSALSPLLVPYKIRNNVTFNIRFFPLPPPFGKSVSGREREKSIRRNRHGFGESPGQKTAAAAAPSAAGVVWGGGKPAAVSASGLSGGDFGEIFLKKNSDFASQTCTIERSIAIVGKEKLGRAVFRAQIILFAECKHSSTFSTMSFFNVNRRISGPGPSALLQPPAAAPTDTPPAQAAAAATATAATQSAAATISAAESGLL